MVIVRMTIIFGFIILSLMGHYISGYNLIYMCILIIFIIPVSIGKSYMNQIWNHYNIISFIKIIIHTCIHTFYRITGSSYFHSNSMGDTDMNMNMIDNDNQNVRKKME